MRVLVTGGGGFTARYLALELRARGMEPIAGAADLLDLAVLSDEVRRAAPATVVHLAGLAYAGTGELGDFVRVNLLGTLNLLEAVARDAHNARMILASTANVYAPPASARLLDESSSIASRGGYALSKQMMEDASTLWATRLPITIVRPFNYTGVGQEPRFLVPKIVDHFRRRTAAITLGNLDVARDFGDVRATAAAYAGLVANAPPGVFNIASGVATSVREVIAMASAITGHEIDVQVNPEFVRADEASYIAGDITRLRALLPGWAPIAFADTLVWMLNSIETAPPAWPSR